MRKEYEEVWQQIVNGENGLHFEGYHQKPYTIVDIVDEDDEIVATGHACVQWKDHWSPGFGATRAARKAVRNYVDGVKREDLTPFEEWAESPPV